MPRIDRFDRAVENAWSRFGARIAAQIVTLRAGEVLDIVADGPTGPTSCVNIAGSEHDTVRVQVTGQEPISASSTSADVVSRRIVTALRDTCGVPHPSFLAGVGDSPYGTLTARVGQALTDQFRRPVPVDADGDFVVVVDSQVVFVVVDELVPRIQLWAPLLHGIADHARVASEVLDANRAWPHIKFVLVEDRLVATVDILGDPFVPRHLTDLFAALRVLLGTVDAGFARRFRGVRYAQSEDTPEPTVFDEPT